MVTGQYLKYVMEEGKAIEFKNKKQKIYSNENEDWYWYGKYTIPSNLINVHSLLICFK